MRVCVCACVCERVVLGVQVRVSALCVFALYGSLCVPDGCPSGLL